MQCIVYTVYTVYYTRPCSTMAGQRPNNTFEMFETCNLLKDFAVLIWSFQTIEKMASVLSVTNFSWIGTRAFQWEASQPKDHLNKIWFKLNITNLNHLNHKMWFIIMNNVHWTSWCRSSWWISEDSSLRIAGELFQSGSHVSHVCSLQSLQELQRDFVFLAISILHNRHQFNWFSCTFRKANSLANPLANSLIGRMFRVKQYWMSKKKVVDSQLLTPWSKTWFTTFDSQSCETFRTLWLLASWCHLHAQLIRKQVPSTQWVGTSDSRKLTGRNFELRYRDGVNKLQRKSDVFSRVWTRNAANLATSAVMLPHCRDSQVVIHNLGLGTCVNTLMPYVGCFYTTATPDIIRWNRNQNKSNERERGNEEAVWLYTRVSTIRLQLKLKSFNEVRWTLRIISIFGNCHLI